jgi:hypothetical protein
MATENKAYIEAMREIRRSSAAQPHRNRKRYTRKAKHKGGTDG